MQLLDPSIKQEALLVQSNRDNKVMKNLLIASISAMKINHPLSRSMVNYKLLEHRKISSLI